MIESLITSKTRIKLLVKFFSNARNRGYLRGLAEEFGESTNSVRIELNRLSNAGLLNWKTEGKTKSYQANENHPLYLDIRNIVRKYLGFDTLIDQVVQGLGSVEKAIICGDYAEGKDTGTIELTIIAEAINKEYLEFLINKTEEKINRKLKVSILENEPVEGLPGLLVYEHANEDT
ncbi:ArsR family transcriptional regulator [uncultured Cyclobacterium sp.]|uniref:ArsR family transcriptional regulator n=1 Tax=uncultured Cyclobacterium sp. TaxID=453820 RepID=UPI0030EC2B36